MRLSDVVAALSYALDLTEGQHPGHAQRTCLLGMRIARMAGVPASDQEALFYALLLEDVGCTSSAAGTPHAMPGGESSPRRSGRVVSWFLPDRVARRPEGRLATNHRGVRDPATAPSFQGRRSSAHEIAGGCRCERGLAILHRLGFPALAATAVGAQEEHWDGTGRPAGVAGSDIPILGRVLCLAQVAEMLHQGRGRDKARRVVRRGRSRWFDPDLADAFLALGDDDPVWEDLAAPDPSVPLSRLGPAERVRPADRDTVDALCDAFALVVDAKSSWTAGHSHRVAAYALRIGSATDLEVVSQADLRRAALLHDIGKLGVPSGVLDKPGRLTPPERIAMKAHTRFTEEILARVSVLRHLAFPAGAHHERLDGRGYHRGLLGDEVPEMARILAVADVFDALTSERPYREGMSDVAALAVLRRESGSALDGTYVDALRSVLPELRADEARSLTAA